MGRVEVQLEDETHNNWVEHKQKSNKYKTLTQLVRYAVGEQIKRDNGEIESREGLNEDAIKRAISDPIKELDIEISSLRNDILETKRVVQSRTEDEQYLNMAMELEEFLPKVKSVTMAIDRSDNGRVSRLTNKYKKEIDEGVNDDKIKIALARLENDVPQVNSKTIDGEKVYYYKNE